MDISLIKLVFKNHFLEITTAVRNENCQHFETFADSCFLNDVTSFQVLKIYDLPIQDLVERKKISQIIQYFI